MDPELKLFDGAETLGKCSVDSQTRRLLLLILIVDPTPRAVYEVPHGRTRKCPTRDDAAGPILISVLRQEPMQAAGLASA